MAISAADVKKLRDETGAPMMDCKAALEEADGDFEKAKTILREKGKAAGAKKADRGTSAGVVAFAPSADGKTVGVAVLECETDFVSNTEDFQGVAAKLAAAFLASDPGANPMGASVDGTTVEGLISDAVGRIRENIQLTKAVRIASDGVLAPYVYQTKTKGAVVEVKGDANNLAEAGYKVAVQVVASPPQAVRKEDLPQDVIAKEIEVETQRAINEGKPENIARNIAQGRVNKEFVKQAALLEQPYYADPHKSVSEVVAEFGKAGGGKIEVVAFHYFGVGIG